MADNPKPGTGAGTRTRERVVIDEPRQYKVVFHNDDFTTMEFVTEVLRRVFNKPADEAVESPVSLNRCGYIQIVIKSIYTTWIFQLI